MKILCNAEDCIYNKPDKDETNQYHRKCISVEVEIYTQSKIKPECFTYEKE